MKRNEEYLSGECLNTRIFYGLSGDGTCKLLETILPLEKTPYLAKRGILGKSYWTVLECGSIYPFTSNVWEHIGFEEKDF